MGTPMAPNCGNIFMDTFERKLLSEYFIQTSVSPLVWFRFIADIFFILTSYKQSLHDLIQFVQDVSEKANLKTKIKFDVNISENSVNFLDVTLQNRTLKESSDN